VDDKNGIDYTVVTADEMNKPGVSSSWGRRYIYGYYLGE